MHTGLSRRALSVVAGSVLLGSAAQAATREARESATRMRVGFMGVSKSEGVKDVDGFAHSRDEATDGSLRGVVGVLVGL